jgi:cytochrome c5
LRGFAHLRAAAIIRDPLEFAAFSSPFLSTSPPLHMSAQPTHHDPEAHASFIKTPQQLITIVVLAFVVPVVLIILLAKAVVSMRAPDPAVLAPEAVAARIKPVADVVIQAGGGAPGSSAKSGEEVYKTVCTACHQTGVANAPKFGDKQAWAGHIAEGLEAMVKAAIGGIRAMPPRGGNPSLSDVEVARAVVYMANAAGADFKEPEVPAAGKATATPSAAAPAAAAPAAAPAPSAPSPAASAPAGAASAAEGKAVYERACVACHQAGVAGAPKFGDKAAWAPRIATGMDALYASVLKGKGAMPPKGGQMAAPDADIKAAVDYMVAAAK